MTNLIDVAIGRSRAVLLVLVFILISGSIAYVNVPKEAAPDVKIPIIYVSMRLDGISSEDGERLLVRPMEKKLQSISGVKEMKSEASEGFASVILEFEAGFNSDRALQDVRAKVDEAKPELPDDAEEPEVHEVNFSLFPVLNIILTGDVSERAMLKVARNLRDKLEGLSQVLEAKIVGDREEVLDIIIDPLTLENYNISLAEVTQRVRNNNKLIAAGDLDTASGSFGIKLPGLVETHSDLMNIPLLNDSKTVVKLSDIAEVKRTFKDVNVLARVNGKRAVGVTISKRTGANIIETVNAAKAIVTAEQELWPSGLEVVYSQDNSNKIRERLNDLENNVLLAVLLVMVVVMLIMGMRAALMVSFAIPGAFLIGVLCISLFGFTMNVVVLFGLILSIGMLVDSAIVVSEYAERKMMDGTPPSGAYIIASKRMAWPIIASTITTLVVFMPLLFWPGIIGQFMKYMPITLIVTLSGSLLMALVFLPVIGTFIGRKKTQNNEKNLNKDIDDSYDDLSQSIFIKRYQLLLHKVLKIPAIFAMSVVAIMISSIMAFGMFGAGVEFFPNIEPENANVIVRARGNLSVKEMDKLAKKVEERIFDMSDEIRVIYSRAGKLREKDLPEDMIALIQLEFQYWAKRRKADDILADIKQRTSDITGVIIETGKQKEGPPRGKDIELEFSSRFPDKIAPVVAQFREAMKDIGGFTNIEDNRPIPSIEWEFEVDRELAGRNNISVVEIGQMIKLVSNGIVVNSYRPDDADDEIDIVARFPMSDRNLGQFERLRVQTKDGLVPITNFVKRVAKQSAGTARRVNNVRAYTVKADLEKGLVIDNKVKEIKEWLMQAKLDPSVNIAFKGEDEDQKEAQVFLMSAFAIALFLMALVLVVQFNSVFLMLVILSAVFLSTGGVFLGLLISGNTFGVVMSGLGVISLAGIVVNNNIIFIDTYLVLRSNGMMVVDALIQTGSQRIRPILLTAGTTVLGLLPMVMEININFITRNVSFGSPSSQWWVQLSTSIAGGLAFATVLTLFFTPAVIYLWDGRKEHNHP